MEQEPKALYAYRHAERDENDILTTKGIENSRKTVVPEIPTDLFHTEHIRTAQTLLALIIGNQINDASILHLPIAQMGSQELYKELDTEELRARVDEGATYIDAILDIFSDEQIARHSRIAGEGIQEMFNQMVGNSGLAIAHDPIITLAAMHFGCADIRSLDHLEYIAFFMDNDGTITVEIP